MTEAADISFADIALGTRVYRDHAITTADIQKFADISGDHNPLHIDSAYAAKTRFERPIAHGMLLGAYVSELIGMHLPGRRAVIVTETLSFKEPVCAGETIRIEGKVSHRSEALRLIDVTITITRGEKIAATGLVQVHILP